MYVTFFGAIQVWGTRRKKKGLKNAGPGNLPKFISLSVCDWTVTPHPIFGKQGEGFAQTGPFSPKIEPDYSFAL